jgi:hypothetical protein
VSCAETHTISDRLKLRWFESFLIDNDPSCRTSGEIRNAKQNILYPMNGTTSRWRSITTTPRRDTRDISFNTIGICSSVR